MPRVEVTGSIDVNETFDMESTEFCQLQDDVDNMGGDIETLLADVRELTDKVGILEEEVQTLKEKDA
jgi:polyhydroxyalkanoate synthesis regulator phasin